MQIFCEFKTEHEAEKAGEHIAGKEYDGRELIVTWFPQEAYGIGARHFAFKQ